MRTIATINKRTEKASKPLDGWRLYAELVVTCAGPVLVEDEIEPPLVAVPVPEAPEPEPEPVDGKLVTTPAEVADD
jgi:hypothetical protein